MTQLQIREWKRAIWSIASAAIITIAANFWMNVQFQATVKEKNRVMEIEISLLRSKIDQMGIVLERKVDRETLDGFLRDITTNTEGMKKTMDKNFSELNKTILDIYKRK